MKDKLVLAMHCSVFGHVDTPIREYKIGEVRPHAQYKQSMTISFKEPGKRISKFVTAKPDGRFYTIERNGEIIYDTRSVVPIDMEEFDRTRARFAADPAVMIDGKPFPGSDVIKRI